MPRFRPIVAVALLVALVAADKKPPVPPLNAAVLKFSLEQVDKKVGNGECWTLAAEALKAAGARPANGYDLGTKLEKDAPVLPGDIFQFKEAKFEGQTGNHHWWITMGAPDHTAVVSKVITKTRYEILQQNPGPVKKAVIDFKDLKSGTWDTYRPAEK